MKKDKKNTGAALENAENSSVLKEILSWVEVIVIAVALAWFLTSFIIVNATVPSGSMENTIQPGDRLLGLRLTYRFTDPQRGDIVVFRYPVNEAVRDEFKAEGKSLSDAITKSDVSHVNYIKRIIGLPGEKVEIKDAKVYINGELLDEPYLKEEWEVRNDGLSYEVPEGCYLMMGDNRNNSADCRYWTERAVYAFSSEGLTMTDEIAESVQYVRRDQILGKAYFRYWPLTSISALK